MEKINSSLNNFIFWCGNENEEFIIHCTEAEAKEYFHEYDIDYSGDCPYCGAGLPEIELLRGRTKKYKCHECLNEFSELFGLFWMHSKITYKQLLLGIWLMCNKRGISSFKLAEDIGVHEKTALYFMEYIRELHNI